MKKVTIELTEETANVLLELLNIANKAAGLQTAEACVYFKNTITKAFSDSEKAEVSQDIK